MAKATRIRVPEFLALADNELRELGREIEQAQAEKTQLEHADRKLTGPAFLTAALHHAKATEEQATALRKAIYAEPERFPNTIRLLREARRWLHDGHCAYPPSTVNRMPGGSGLASAVDAELAVVQGNVFQAFAVAVAMALEEFPKRFGTRDNYAGVEVQDGRVRKLGEMIARWDRERQWLRAVLALRETKAVLGQEEEA